MLCVFLYFYVFFGGGVLELFRMGRFFCKSKDFKAFLRCSCVYFFPFVFAMITIIICIFLIFFVLFDLQRKKKICVPKGSVSFGDEDRMRKAFICKQINLTMQNHFDWSCRLLKTPP